MKDEGSEAIPKDGDVVVEVGWVANAKPISYQLPDGTEFFSVDQDGTIKILSAVVDPHEPLPACVVAVMAFCEVNLTAAMGGSDANAPIPPNLIRKIAEYTQRA